MSWIVASKMGLFVDLIICFLSNQKFQYIKYVVTSPKTLFKKNVNLSCRSFWRTLTHFFTPNFLFLHQRLSLNKRVLWFTWQFTSQTDLICLNKTSLNQQEQNEPGSFTQSSDCVTGWLLGNDLLGERLLNGLW